MATILAQTSDGTLIDSSGKVIFFSVDRFVSQIALGNHCFICGADPADKSFNDEHVLPRWILKKHSLFARKIVLPNTTDFKYDKYVVPCCVECNSLMNRVIESPIQRLFNKGYESIVRHMRSHGTSIFFNWLALIYLKTHLKDTGLALDRDARKPHYSIGDTYSWEELHHVHCLARSFYTRAAIHHSAYGTMLVLPMKVRKHYENFDFIDLYESRSILLHIDDVAFIAVLNDSCAASNLCSGFLRKKIGQLSPIQLREIFARISFANVILKERPTFYTEVDLRRGRVRIRAKLPRALKINPYDETDFGSLLERCCGPLLADTDEPRVKFMREQMKLGRYTFTFDESGAFISKSMELKGI
jgi:hypothetical protein